MNPDAERGAPVPSAYITPSVAAARPCPPRAAASYQKRDFASSWASPLPPVA